MNKRIRQEIAQEAAKIIANSGNEDYLLAKKKAANQLGIRDKRDLPSNTEIESALIEYQSLFQYQQPDNLNTMRETALKAMQFFENFQPLLTGSVLSGTANKHSEIILHLFADTSEMVALFLDNKQIPYELCERRLQFRKNSPVYFPAIRFIAGNYDVVAIVLPLPRRKQSPLDPVNGKPMQRIKIKDLAKLMEDSTQPLLSA